MIRDSRAGTPAPGIQSRSPRRSAPCPTDARHRALAARPPRHEPHRRRRACAPLPDLQGRDRRRRRRALAALLLAALQAGRSRRVAERVVSDPRRGAGRRRGPAVRRGTARDLSDDPRVNRRPRAVDADAQVIAWAGRPREGGEDSSVGRPERRDLGTGGPIYLQRSAQVSAGNHADRCASMTPSASVHDRPRTRRRPRRPTRTAGAPRGRSFPSPATRRTARRGSVDRSQSVRSIVAS